MRCFAVQLQVTPAIGHWPIDLFLKYAAVEASEGYGPDKFD